jgi:hypothetical protein
LDLCRLGIKASLSRDSTKRLNHLFFSIFKNFKIGYIPR